MFAIADYLNFSVISLGYVVLFFSPIIYAAILANFPSKLLKRIQFSVVCGALSYGSIILAEVVLLPIHMAAMFLAPSWHASGYLEIAKYSYVASEYSFVLTGFVGVVVAIWLPLHIRKGVWQRIYPPSS